MYYYYSININYSIGISLFITIRFFYKTNKEAFNSITRASLLCPGVFHSDFHKSSHIIINQNLSILKACIHISKNSDMSS